MNNMSKTKSVKKCNCMCHDTGDRSDAYCRHCKSAKWIKNFTKPPVYQNKSFVKRILKKFDKRFPYEEPNYAIKDFLKQALHQQLQEIKKRLPKKRNTTMIDLRIGTDSVGFNEALDQVIKIIDEI